MKTPNYYHPFNNKKEMKIEFLRLANILGLVKNNKYVDGIPNGTENDINKFYLYEDKLDYPKPQNLKS